MTIVSDPAVLPRPRHIFVLAAAVESANECVRTLMTNPLNRDAVLVAVLTYADLHGRAVMAGDDVVIAGDWSGADAERVKRTVDMFNTRRQLDGDTPKLHYRPGEAPIVSYPYSIQPTAATAATTTTTTSAGVAWGQVLAPAEQRAVQDAQDAVKRERAISADMRTQVKKVNAEIDAVLVENRELRQWLSGVLPVEDTEIPGLLYCGVCGKNLQDHADGCPAAGV